MITDLERAKARVVVESPLHGPIVVARVVELEAKLAGREHTFDASCWCGPVVVDGGRVVQHR